MYLKKLNMYLEKVLEVYGKNIMCKENEDMVEKDGKTKKTNEKNK